MPPSLVFDMHDGETAAAPATAKVVTQKRKATGDAVTIVYRGVGPVADIKEGFAMPLLELAVVEDIDTSKRSRAVLTAIGDGGVGAVLLPPVHEKSAVKAAYLADQGTQKALVPWAKLPAMHDTTWMGPYMTISDALKEYTKPKSRVPATVKEAAVAQHGAAAPSAGDAHSEAAARAKKSAKEPSKKKAAVAPVALPTVTVPKPIHEIRRVAPNPVRRTQAEESDSDVVDLTRASDDSESEDDTDDDSEAQTDDSSEDDDSEDDKPLASAAGPDEPEDDDEPDQSDDDEEGSEVDTDDAESAAESENESDDERPAKRRRTFEVTAKYLDDDREMIARFKVHSKAEMNRVFGSFRESGCV